MRCSRCGVTCGDGAGELVEEVEAWPAHHYILWSTPADGTVIDAPGL